MAIHMTTLTNQPISELLEQLFAEADSTDAALENNIMSAEDRTILRTSKSDYRQLYSRMKGLFLPVSRETGRLLYLLARAVGARSIVEYGTSFGLSTLHLGAALRDNGGGRLIGSEFEPSKIARARQNIAAAGLSDLIEIREGDALQTLARDLPEAIDFVLLDGAKALYPAILSLLEPHLRAGALIIADNADHCPEYLALVRSPGSGYVSVPFGAEVELTMRIGSRLVVPGEALTGQFPKRSLSSQI
jgi:predicted O-methyltransferase YrrM